MTAYMPNGTTIHTDDGRTLYHDLDAYLGKKNERPGPSRNVRIRRNRDESIAVCLHYTDVVTVYPFGAVSLAWNGWYTTTTHKVMNDYLPRGFHVSGLRDTLLCEGWSRAWVAFDGLTIGPRGGVHATSVGAPDEYLRKQKNARAREARKVKQALALAVAQDYANFRAMCDGPDTIAEVQDIAELENERGSRWMYRPDMYYTMRPNVARVWTLRKGIADQRRREALYKTDAAYAHDVYRDALAQEVSQCQRDADAEHRRYQWRETLTSCDKQSESRAWKYLILLAKDGNAIVSNHDWSPWIVGEWRDERVLRECVGLNCSRTREQAYGYVPGNVLALVEYAGSYHEGPDKITADSMRIVCAWIRRDDDAQEYHNWSPGIVGTNEWRAPDFGTLPEGGRYV